MEREKVLITGGAGFLGINLIRHLMAHRYGISSLDVEEFDYPERDGIETIKGDIRNKALVDRAMEDADLVVHTAAALPLYSPKDIYTTDVEGTRNVLEAARRHGVKRVVHVSSTAVYGIPADHPSQVVRRPRAARGLRAALRLGLHRARLPYGRERQQPLPTPGRRGPLRGYLPHAHAPGDPGQRHLQHRRQRVHDDEGGLPGRPRLRWARQKGGRFPGGARDLGPQSSGQAGALAALQVGLRDGLQRLVRLYREGRAGAGLRA